MGKKIEYSVYVIELNKKVLKHKKFKDANPNYDTSKHCVYVGSTELNPEERFKQHKEGHYKNGKLKVISFFAKKARGEMVNFIIKNKINSVEELKLFKNNGYLFSHQNKSDILFYRW